MARLERWLGALQLLGAVAGASGLTLGGSNQDLEEVLELPACMDKALTEIYAMQLPELDILQRVEAAMKDGNCIELQIPSAAGISFDLGPDDKVGPPHFVEKLTAKRKSHEEFIQIQPTGISAEPEELEKLINVATACKHYLVDEERAVELQNWTMCTLFSDDAPSPYDCNTRTWEEEDGEDDGEEEYAPKKNRGWGGIEGALGPLVRELQASKTLSIMQFSQVNSDTLVEWHCDHIFSLLSEDKQECDDKIDRDFKTFAYHPWQHRTMMDLRFHMPLSAQEDVRIYMSGARVRMNPGDLVVFDWFQPHTVGNVGAKPRTHLIFDFAVSALKREKNMRRLLSTRVGRAVLAGIFGMGYQRRDLNDLRQDVEWELKDYYRELCQEGDPHRQLGLDDEIIRLERERTAAGLSAQRNTKPKKRSGGDGEL